jgi:hypothetical protein
MSQSSFVRRAWIVTTVRTLAEDSFQDPKSILLRRSGRFYLFGKGLEPKGLINRTM